MQRSRAAVNEAIAVAGGAAIGGVVRHLATGGATSLRASLLRVCAVNVAGSFALGAAARLQRGGAISPRAALAVSAGFCGGLTTFSTFASGGWAALREEHPALAVLYMCSSCVLGVCAVACGEVVAGRVLKK